MKLHEFLKQFENLDPETEILIGNGLMEGWARERVIPFTRYVTSIPKYGCDRKYHYSKTKIFKKEVIVLTT